MFITVLEGTLNAFELEKNSEMGKKEEEEKRLEMQTNKSLYELLLTFFYSTKADAFSSFR